MSARLTSLLGCTVMVALAWLLSSRKKMIPWRVIAWGTGLQLSCGWVVLRTAPGRWFFDGLGAVFQRLLGFVDDGARFVFGPRFLEFPFAFKVLPTLIFFSALTSVLYHYGLLQRLVRLAAHVMSRSLRTSGAESLAAAANIFVGMNEAPLVVRPYVEGMTRSELMSLMVVGLATIAGSVMAAYVAMGIDAGHLMAASLMSAPAGILVAKVLEPETEAPRTMGGAELSVETGAVNGIDALARGATDGLRLALNIAAVLLAFLAVVALVNFVVAGCGNLFGLKWSLEGGLGYAFAPLAWLMGIESGDCLRAGELLGLRTVANEFLAYERLGAWLGQAGGSPLSERTVIILTYALCGFANLGSIGILIAGIGPLAPSRQADLARLGFRAMLGGMLACFMTACVAGMLL